MTAPSPRPLVTRRRVVVSVLLALAAVGIVYAFNLHEEPEPVRYTHAAIVAVMPKPGAEVPRQTEVFVELKPGYDVIDIIVGDDAVQRDDLDVITGLNRFGFVPGEDEAIEKFESGRTCPTVEFVAVTEPKATPQRFSWCFSVD